jgi:hypothetical protein
MAPKRSDETMERLIDAAERGDAAEFIATLSHDVVVRSPITQGIRFEGIEQATALFTHVFAAISDVRIYEHLGKGTSTQAIFWRGRVGKHYLEEANLIRLDDTGQVGEMTVFMRPIPGVMELAARLAPKLARDRSRLRSVPVRMMLRVITTLYRTNEPLVLALTGAGVPLTKSGERRRSQAEHPD